MEPADENARETSASDLPPWEQPGAVRRDCESHRGHLVEKLGTTALVFGGLSLTCFACPALFLFPLLALYFGVTAFMMGGHELQRMKAGVVDPRGWDQVARGAWRGRLGVALAAASGLGLLAWVWLVGG